MKGKKYALAVALVVVAIVAYSIGELMNLIPQPVKDLVSWADTNTVALLVTLCFIVACVTIVKVVGRKKIVEALKKSEYSACVVGLIMADQPNVSEGRDYLSMAEAWFNDHFLVLAFTFLFLAALTVVALVAGYKRRRERR